MKLDKWTGFTVLCYGIVAVFMVVTVGHVAHYAGTFEPVGLAWLGWPYAIAVDLAIVATALLTRWKTTSFWAWSGYFVFTAASGVMNAAHVRPWAQPAPFAAWVYAEFPTVAISLLGFLARDVTKRIKGRKASDGDTQPIADVAQGNGHKPLMCEFCDVPIPSGTQQGRSAHLRRCPVYLAQKKEGQRERV